MATRSVSMAGLSMPFGSALDQMIAASGGKIWVVSGFRSVERQAQLFANAKRKYGSEAAARKWVAPPGKSNHNKGEAADLGGDLALAHRLAPQFGLVFPMSHEPWHIERAGTRDHSSPDAYTTPPSGDPGGSSVPVRKDLEFYLATFMDIARTGRPSEELTFDELEAMGIPAAAFADTEERERDQLGLPNQGSGNIADIDRFMYSLRKKESGGRYNAIGPSTRHGTAKGAYQYIDDTWGGRRGYANAAAAPANVQDEEARKDIQRLFQKYGRWDLVAVAWHGGTGAADAALASGRITGADSVTTTDRYVREILAGMDLR